MKRFSGQLTEFKVLAANVVIPSSYKILCIRSIFKHFKYNVLIVSFSWVSRTKKKRINVNRWPVVPHEKNIPMYFLTISICQIYILFLCIYFGGDRVFLGKYIFGGRKHLLRFVYGFEPDFGDPLSFSACLNFREKLIQKQFISTWKTSRLDSSIWLSSGE